jgi:hypothetical protein
MHDCRSALAQRMRDRSNLARMSDWRAEAELLVDQVLRVAPTTTVTRDQPTDRLLLITLHPSAEGAAEVRLVVSEREVIVNAGRGMHSDLGALPSSRDEAIELMLGVIYGGLTERIGSWGVRSELILPDGGRRRVWTGRGCLPRPRRTRVVTYSRFEAVDFGCDYCRDDQNRWYGHVTQIGSSEERRTILLRCPRCHALYENVPRGLDRTRRLTEAEAERLFPGSAATP